MKIGTKLLIGYSVLVFLIVILTLFTLHVNSRYMQEESGKSSIFLAEEMVRRVDYGIYLHIDCLRQFTQNPVLIDYLLQSNEKLDRKNDVMNFIEKRRHLWDISDKGEKPVAPFIEEVRNNQCSQFLTSSFFDYYQINRGYFLFSEMSITSRYGTVCCTAGKNEDYYNADKSWWQEVNERDIVINEVLLSEGENAAMLEVGIAIEDLDRNFIGALHAFLSLPALLRETEIIIKRYTTSEIQLISDKGFLLYASNAHRFMEDLSHSTIFKQLKKESGFFIAEDGNKEKLVSYAVSKGYGSFSGLGWIVILKHDVQDILKEMIILRKVMVTASGIIFALALSISFIISRSIKKPLSLLHSAALEVGKGNFSYRIPRDQIKKYEKNEIGEFSKTFNAMTAQVEGLYADLERSNKELDDFSYIVSHDLREPLRGIRNYVEIITEDYSPVLDDEGKELLNTLSRLTTRLDNLIQSLLTYSRAGRFELSFEETDINDLIKETIESIAFFLEENNARVTIAEPLPSIICDRTRVGEVFYNLITNAVKYNDKEQKEIEIGIDRSFEPPRFYVKDNGIGIPEKHLETVFKIFKRLHPRDRYGGGTGSGLTIVRKLIYRHGGSIWAESEPGEGSVFRFTLQGGND